MTFRQPLVRLSALALVFLLVGGCGPARPKTAAVKGTVTYKSEPVEGAAVMFQREGARPATGQTGDDGTFTLTTFDPNDGAVPGDYTVTITKVESIAMTTDGDAGREPPKSSSGPPKSLIPQKYADPKTSGLQETVASPGPNEFEFELVD